MRFLFSWLGFLYSLLQKLKAYSSCCSQFSREATKKRWQYSDPVWTDQLSSRRTLSSSNMLLDREHHQQERENSSLKRSFNLICKWSTRFGRCYHSVQSKKLKLKMGSCLVSFVTGGMNNDEMRWLPNYERAESKAQRFLRRFIKKSETISPKLFENYILDKAMPMFLRMHIKEEAFIDALPRGRLNRYTSDWMNPPVEERRKCYMDRLSAMFTKQHWERTETSTRKGLEIGTHCRVFYNHSLCSNKSTNTHTSGAMQSTGTNQCFMIIPTIDKWCKSARESIPCPYVEALNRAGSRNHSSTNT